MASGKLYNLARMTTATTGTGTISLGSAVSGFLTFANAGVTNGAVVSYAIRDGVNSEIGYGTYTTSGLTLTRTVLNSTNAGSAINLSGSAEVFITPAATNFSEWNATHDANGYSIGFDDNTGIFDDSGNETLLFRKTTSAVNYVEVLNSATGVGPTISAKGDNSNVILNLAGKGTGGVAALFGNAAGLGLSLWDSDSSHALNITTGSNLTSARTLTINTGDASRTMTFGGDVVTPTLMAMVATTSGTSIDFTSIPAGVKRITVMIDGMSTNGTSIPILQLGDSGGIETSGYSCASSRVTSAVASANYTTGFGIGDTMAATVIYQGAWILTLMDASTNLWICTAVFSRTDAAATAQTAGSKALTGTLDRIRLTTVGGVNTFDAGNMSVMYEG